MSVWNFLIALRDAVAGLLVELGDADIADVVAFLMRAHRLDLDHRAGQLDVLRFLLRAAQDLERHRRIGRAAHLVDGLVEGQPLHVLAIDGGDDVARENAAARGRRIVDRGHDLDEAVLLRHFDAEPAELAARLHLHVLEALGVHIARMRIERGRACR